MSAELHVGFADDAALEREYAANFVHGRAFVADVSGYELFSLCTLVLQHPRAGDELKISCDVVMVRAEAPMRGVALQFRDRSAQAQQRLRAFVFDERGRASAAAPLDLSPSEPCHAAHPMVEARTADDLDDDAPLERPDDPFDAEADTATDFDDFDEAEIGELSGVAGAPHEADGSSMPPDSPPARERSPLRLSDERRQRLRNLPPGERMKVARGPVLEDRVLLERIYGSNVWEQLLRNPRVTIPEVARMARKGTMPRPLLEIIVDNEQWIRNSLIRRALLSNPRLSPEAATKVLRSMSARELKLVPQQTAYPDLVRKAAQRLMRGA